MIVAIVLTVSVFLFARTVPAKKPGASAPLATGLSTDSILQLAREKLPPGMARKLWSLENMLATGADRELRLRVFHDLAHFWKDSVRVFEPYAWFEAEAARLENSEKSLTFAAHLFLENLLADSDSERKKWKAIQARDLFERSLIINPANDSSKVGLGATYLFGSISSNPMEGVNRIREVVERDSTHVYGQMTLARASVLSGQYDKALSRLQLVARIDSRNVEAILMTADVLERMERGKEAAAWYEKSLQFVERPEVRQEIERRIAELKK